MSTETEGGKLETADDIRGSLQSRPVKLWRKELDSAKKFMEKFHKSGAKINRRYLDKREATQDNEVRVNLFWSTMQVVMSLLYAKPPKVDVSRLYADFNDEPARVGSEILERMLNNDVSQDGSRTSNSVRQAIQDWALVGLGQVWNRYDVEIAETVDPMTGMAYSQVVGEQAPTEYVHWQDFLYSPARVWDEVRWVARRSYLTKEKLVKRFGDEVANMVRMGVDKQQKETQYESDKLPDDPWTKAPVWEIWDKDTMTVYWYTDNCDVILDERPDPLKLDGFFPCPEPLIANATTTELVPRADYLLAQDQFDQLDEINTRIGWLVRGMKLVGVYDASAEGVQRMLNQATENQLIPVDNWAMFAESGGVKSKIEWMPIQEVSAVVERLVMLREQVKGQIYEVLGISDIMRGNSRASETLGAQQIKAQFGSTRVQLKQYEVAKFVQRALNNKSEIICRHFQPQNIARQSNVMMTPDAQYAMQAIQLIKNPDASKYRVQVQAETMAYVDKNAENQRRTEALTAIGQFIQQVMGLAQQMPGAAPFMMEIVKWYGAGFTGYQEIEGIMDRAIDSANKMMRQPKQPSPKEMAEVQRDYAEIEEKKAGALERRAGASKDLAEAALKAQEAGINPPPVPPELFLPPMGGRPFSPGQGIRQPAPVSPQGPGQPPQAAPPVNRPPPPPRPPMPAPQQPQMPPRPPMPPGGQP